MLKSEKNLTSSISTFSFFYPQKTLRGSLQDCLNITSDKFSTIHMEFNEQYLMKNI